MMTVAGMNGLAGIALAFMALALSLPGVARLPQRLRLGLAYGIAIVSLIPLGTLSLAACVRGGTGDLSITAQVLLVLAVLRKSGVAQPAVAGRQELLLLVAVAAAGLYPLALGLGLFDPYRLGYGNAWFLVLLLALALGTWWRGLRLIALTLALAVLAWSVGWGESSNLWDYLLDPLLAFYAVGALLRQGVQALPGRHRG